MRAHLDCRPRDNVVTFLHRVWSATMTITTLTSRQFNQDAGGAKKAAERGPVIITDRGKPAHVLLGIQEYRRLIGSRRKIADLLAMPGGGDRSEERRVGKECVSTCRNRRTPDP